MTGSHNRSDEGGPMDVTPGVEGSTGDMDEIAAALGEYFDAVDAVVDSITDEQVAVYVAALRPGDADSDSGLVEAVAHAIDPSPWAVTRHMDNPILTEAEFARWQDDARAAARAAITAVRAWDTEHGRP